MRKAVLVIAILMVILLVELMTQMPIAKANMIIRSGIVIHSPVSYENRVYQTSTINLSISADSVASSPGIKRISYSLDGKPNVTLSVSQDFYDASGTGTLENLTDGYHTLKAYALRNVWGEISTSTTFLVNTTAGYPAFLVSPLNTTYNKNEVSLNYTTNNYIPNYNREASVCYSLDNSSYSSLGGNITLTGLSEGKHSITVRAIDTFGVLYSEQTANFTIDTTKKEQTLDNATLTAIVAIILGVLALCSVLVVVIYRKRKIGK